MILHNKNFQLNFRFLVLCISFLLIVLISGQSWATCQINTRPQYLETDDGSAAKIRFGNIQLMNQAIQPLGSVIASTIVAPTEFRGRNANSESILWTCDEGDQNDITFLVSTNGDDYYGVALRFQQQMQAGNRGYFIPMHS